MRPWKDAVVGSALDYSLKHMGPPRKFGSPVDLYHRYATVYFPILSRAEKIQSVRQEIESLHYAQAKIDSRHSEAFQAHTRFFEIPTENPL